VASGSLLLVDVEFGRGRTLYALSDGTFTPVTTGLDRPTSLEFIGTTAYVVTLGGDIWKIDGVSGPPYGTTR
jgi:hypothetical protein